MNIEALEQRYRALLADFQAGKIDEPTFISELDGLEFQDDYGHHWMIGAQTGLWYYYDRHSGCWQQADPHQADQLPMIDSRGRFWQRDEQSGDWYCYQSETGEWRKGDWQVEVEEKGFSPAAPPPHTSALLSTPRPPASARFRFLAFLWAIPARSMLMMSAAFIVLLALMVWPVGGAPPLGGPALAPSPRPPLGGGASGGGGGGDDGGGGNGTIRQSAIVGTVTDLSTGRPGAGIEVLVSGQIVRTDTDGSYSITGLAAGEYTVSPDLQGQGTPAHGPVFVSVDGQNSVTVDLGYRSQAQPLPTDTPQPAAVAAASPPPTLPDSGAPIGYRPLVIVGLGFLLTLFGGIVHNLFASTRG